MGVDSTRAEAVGMKARYEDVLNAPENTVASALGMALGEPVHRGRGGPGGWWILDEPELHLSEHVVVPDLAGWRRERLPSLPDDAYFSLAPDWVCEVLSPSTERIDRVHKLRIYAQAGVSHAWLLDPTQRIVEVLRLQGATWLIAVALAGEGVMRVEPFDAVDLDLGSLWE
jgi:Uma2 family endonuclease